MENGNFGFLRAVTAAAMTVSVALICCACVLPRAIISELYRENLPYINRALTATREGRNEAAHGEMLSVCGSIDEKRQTLMLFFDHNEVTALVNSAETARELSLTDDAPQLIAELMELRSVFEFMIHLHDANLFSIF